MASRPDGEARCRSGRVPAGAEESALSGNLVELFEPVAGYHDRPAGPRTQGGTP